VWDAVVRLGFEKSFFTFLNALLLQLKFGGELVQQQ
jgi:hypothetical protein